MAGRVGSGSLKTGSVAVYAQQPVVCVQQPAVLTVFDSLSLAASRKPERGVLLALAWTGTVRGEAGAGAMSSPAAVLRTGYASSTGIAVDEGATAQLATGAPPRSGCYSVNRMGQGSASNSLRREFSKGFLSVRTSKGLEGSG